MSTNWSSLFSCACANCFTLFRSEICLKASDSIARLLAVISMFFTIDFGLKDACFNLLIVLPCDATFFLDFTIDVLDFRSASFLYRHSVSNSFSLAFTALVMQSILGCFLWLSSFTWSAAVEHLSSFALLRYLRLLVCLGLRLVCLILGRSDDICLEELLFILFFIDELK